MIRLNSPFRMAMRSLAHYRVSTVITAISVALATGLMMAVFSIQTQSYRAFTGGPYGYDAVLGSRGSQLQLVLNAVFHLETSPGNIKWSLYEAIKKDPSVELAVPYALGDNYYGHRIVGTIPELFTDFEYQTGKRYALEPGGRVFDPLRRELVIGSTVAQKFKLSVGSKIKTYHGLSFDPNMVHNEIFVVVGVMEPTNTPADGVLWTPLEAFFRMGGHVLRGAGEEYTPESNKLVPDEHKELSAVMLKLVSPQAGMRLNQTINFQGKEATLAWPIGNVMAQLFDKLGWMNRLLGVIAWLMVVVASASILASVYNTIQGRQREFAILRSLGARRPFVLRVILWEAVGIAMLGNLLGYAVYAGIGFGASWIVKTQIGVVLDPFYFHDILWISPLVMACLGVLAGIVPALRAYATDVVHHLTPTV